VLSSRPQDRRDKTLEHQATEDGQGRPKISSSIRPRCKRVRPAGGGGGRGYGPPPAHTPVIQEGVAQSCVGKEYTYGVPSTGPPGAEGARLVPSPDTLLFFFASSSFSRVRSTPNQVMSQPSCSGSYPPCALKTGRRRFLGSLATGSRRYAPRYVTSSRLWRYLPSRGLVTR
jgi:hypothetical protein